MLFRCTLLCRATFTLYHTFYLLSTPFLKFFQKLSQNFGKIAKCGVVYSEGKVQQKRIAGRDIERGKVKGFGKLPISLFHFRARDLKTASIASGYSLAMLAVLNSLVFR